MTSGQGVQRTERSITAAGDVRVQAGTDILLGTIDAANGNVNLSAGLVAASGSVLDGDASLDVTANNLSVQTGSTGGAGSSSDALDVNLHDTLGSLTADVGQSGLYLRQEGTLRVNQIESLGEVALQSQGDLLMGKLDATGQAVTLTVAGAVSVNNAVSVAGDGTRLMASDLVVNATEGFGSADAPLLADVDTLTAQAGDGGVFLEELNSLRVISASGDGPLAVSAPQGTFEALSEQSFSSPMTVVSADADVSAKLSGESIEFKAPQKAVGATAPLPFVIGTPITNVTPEEAVFLDNEEIANLDFQDITLGSTQAGQEIWLQTDPENSNDKLAFKGHLTLKAALAGETRFSGLIQGKGMTLNGSGSTTYFQGADILHTASVTINDALDVTNSSILEIGDEDPNTRLVLSIHGNITVRAGQTLQLLADEIVFGAYPGASSAKVVLEAGATLVLGTDRITVDAGVTFDSDGGHLVLRGAPSSTPVNGGLMHVDFVPADLQFESEATEALVAWLAADQDGDAGLDSWTLGDVAATTSVSSATIWNGLTDTAVLLRGQVVHLGQSGQEAWNLTHDAVIRATSGELRQHVDLLARGDLSLVANQGQILMDAGTQIAGNHAVALTATTGIQVGQITADERIELFSPAGHVRAAQALPGQAHLEAPAVSFFGFGLTMPVATAESVMVVDAQALQVSAPTGSATRGYWSDGSVYYRLMNKTGMYHQLQIFDESQVIDRVMVPRSDLVAQAAQMGLGEELALSLVADRGLSSWLATYPVRDLSPTDTAVGRYLISQPPVLISTFAETASFDAFGIDELDSIDYGASDALVMESVLDGHGNLLRSTGQSVYDSSWSINAEI